MTKSRRMRSRQNRKSTRRSGNVMFRRSTRVRRRNTVEGVGGGIVVEEVA